MDAVDFEARYRQDPDPWNYRESQYEQSKYAATLQACGDGPFTSALELGASIGVFTELLAPRCRALTSIDLAPTAVATARRALADHPHVDVRLGTVPEEFPTGVYDLIVASEILYYLPLPAVGETLRRAELASAPGTRFVAVHWRPSGPDRWADAAQVHGMIRAQAWLEPISSGGTDEYRLDVLECR